MRNSWCEYPAAGDNAAFRHDDLLVVFRDFDLQVRAVFWDNHGNLIRYTTADVDSDRSEFTFESDPSIPGPRNAAPLSRRWRRPTPRGLQPAASRRRDLLAISGVEVVEADAERIDLAWRFRPPVGPPPGTTAVDE